MSAAAKRHTTSSLSETVVPFPDIEAQRTRTSSDYTTRSIEAAIRDAISSIDLRRELENAVSAAIQSARWLSHVDDDPFDAVYLSALEMDGIAEKDVIALKQYSTIVDRSEELIFPDN